GRVDWVADAKPFLETYERHVLTVAVVVVRRSVACGATRAVELAHRGGDEVDRVIARPLLDRAWLLIRGGEQDRQDHGDCEHDAERDREFSDEVIGSVAALPHPRGDVLTRSALAACHGAGSGASGSTPESGNGGTTPCLRTSST